MNLYAGVQKIIIAIIMISIKGFAIFSDNLIGITLFPFQAYSNDWEAKVLRTFEIVSGKSPISAASKACWIHCRKRRRKERRLKV
jgi:hypothetical protein